MRRTARKASRDESPGAPCHLAGIEALRWVFAQEKCQLSLLRASGTIGGLTLLSRLLGFVRDVLMARYVGAGFAADAFLVAFRLPNLFRALFAEGAFNAAFVPMFNSHLAKEEG